MKYTFGLTALLSLAASVLAENGPFSPAGYTTHSSLPRHTIYRPQGGNPGAMPVFIWANGACAADGTSLQTFLKQIASHGYLVISQGVPGGKGSSSVAMMREAVTWAANGANGLFNVDRNKIMTAGASCGGTEAYEFVNDNRVSSIGIFNSGLLGNFDFAATIKKPVMYALGGPSDIAYPNGERDYGRIPSGTPAWKGNVNRVGHTGTYFEANGGLFAKATVNWLNWLYKGNTAGRTYLQSQAVGDGWSNAVNKNFDSAKVPIGGGGGSTTPPPTNPPPSEGCASALYGQCGGNGWTGCKRCSQGTCKATNEWYSQCVP